MNQAKKHEMCRRFFVDKLMMTFESKRQIMHLQNMHAVEARTPIWPQVNMSCVQNSKMSVSRKRERRF
jgi:hypothetical protein